MLIKEEKVFQNCEFFIDYICIYYENMISYDNIRKIGKG